MGLRVPAPMTARLQGNPKGTDCDLFLLFLAKLRLGLRVKKWLRYPTFILLLIACTGCAKSTAPPHLSAKPAEADILLVAGSGANISLTRRLAEEYSRQSGSKVDVPGSIGTIGAIKAIREGAIPMGLASRSLTQEEKAQGLKQIRYAEVGLAIAVSSSVEETTIEEQTLIQIYSGEKTAWRNGAEIIALCMYEGDSTNAVLGQKMPALSSALQVAAARKSWKVLYSEGAMLETLLKTPNAIGFVDAATLRENQGKVRALSLNGVEMNANNLQTGRYPLKKNLYFIYRGEPSDSAKRFIDFCFSEAGRKLILAAGALPTPWKE